MIDYTMREKLNAERLRQEASIVGDAPYMPKLTYSCDDYSCCWNGCPIAFCRVCGQEWPCADYRAEHNEAQVKAQIRWMKRKWQESGDSASELEWSVDAEFDRLVTTST